tara:strand:+ start:1922 stop:2443 length:522 start_codon:yes stop_codon:yes gene_type:complete
MPLTPTNYLYENLLTKIESILRIEYDGSLPIYIGEEYKKNRNSHIRIFIDNISNIDSKEKSIVNLCNFSINLYLNIRSNDVQAKKKLTDMTNRLEQVLFENQLNDNNLYFDGRIESIETDIKEDEEVFVDNLRVSRINYSVKIPLVFNTYGFFLLSNEDNFLTSSSDKFLVLN